MVILLSFDFMIIFWKYLQFNGYPFSYLFCICHHYQHTNSMRETEKKKRANCVVLIGCTFLCQYWIDCFTEEKKINYLQITKTTFNSNWKIRMETKKKTQFLQQNFNKHENDHDILLVHWPRASLTYQCT